MGRILVDRFAPGFDRYGRAVPWDKVASVYHHRRFSCDDALEGGIPRCVGGTSDSIWLFAPGVPDSEGA